MPTVDLSHASNFRADAGCYCLFFGNTGCFEAIASSSESAAKRHTAPDPLSIGCCRYLGDALRDLVRGLHSIQRNNG